MSGGRHRGYRTPARLPIQWGTDSADDLSAHLPEICYTHAMPSTRIKPKPSERDRFRAILAKTFGHRDGETIIVDHRHDYGHAYAVETGKPRIGTVTRELPLTVPCHLCRKDAFVSPEMADHRDYFELDHIVPAAKGGRYVAENLLPAHRKCNASRQDTDLAPGHVDAYWNDYSHGEQWMTARGGANLPL